MFFFFVFYRAKVLEDETHLRFSFQRLADCRVYVNFDCRRKVESFTVWLIPKTCVMICTSIITNIIDRTMSLSLTLKNISSGKLHSDLFFLQKHYRADFSSYKHPKKLVNISIIIRCLFPFNARLKFVNKSNFHRALWAYDEHFSLR